MTLEETAKLLALMRTVWDDTSGTDPADKAMAYSLMLADVSYEDAQAAFVVCGRELTFFPKPAEILERLPWRGPTNAYEVLKAPPKSAHHLLHDGERLVG